MGPKVDAALTFLQAGGHRAIITSAALLDAAAAGRPGAGTVIEAARVPVPSGSGS
jgi:carbamate kinase